MKFALRMKWSTNYRRRSISSHRRLAIGTASLGPQEEATSALCKKHSTKTPAGKHFQTWEMARSPPKAPITELSLHHPTSHKHWSKTLSMVMSRNLLRTISKLNKRRNKRGHARLQAKKADAPGHKMDKIPPPTVRNPPCSHQDSAKIEIVHIFYKIK
jgi:hypothetical protein